MAIHLSVRPLYSPDNNIETFFNQLNTPFKIKNVDFRGRPMRYVETGLQNVDAPIILFIHGAPGTWDAYKSFLADYELRDMARLISVDRLGHGSSDRGNPEIDLEIHAASIKSILDRYQSQKTIVVGHSYGAPIAAMLAANYPEIVSGVVMCAPLNDPENEPLKWYSKMANWTFSKWLLPAYINVATEEKMNHSHSLERIKHKWADIKSPIIHIHGEQDLLAPCKENITFSKKNIPANWLNIRLLKSAGHLIIWEESVIIKQNVVQILSKAKIH